MVVVLVAACRGTVQTAAEVGSTSGADAGVIDGGGGAGGAVVDAGQEADAAPLADCGPHTNGMPCVTDGEAGWCYTASNGPTCCAGCVGFSADAGGLVCYETCPGALTCANGLCSTGI